MKYRIKHTNIFRYETEVEQSTDLVEGPSEDPRWEKTEKGYLYTFGVPADAKAVAVLEGKTFALNIGINKIEL